MERIVLLLFACAVAYMLVARLTGAADPLKKDEAVITLHPSGAEEEATGAGGGSDMNLSLPVPGTSLTAEWMVCYEGPFIEDGSDTPVSNMTALVVRNSGETEIIRAEVLLDRDGQCLRFSVSHVLPGMGVMVLEQGSATYKKGEITSCCGWAETAENEEDLLGLLNIAAVDMGTLEITNVSDRTLSNLCLYHKNYLPDGTYVGGITYKTLIGQLEPGQTVYVQPEHYADGYSKIYKAAAK